MKPKQAQAARESASRVTALGHQGSAIARLREAYTRRKHDAAPGVEDQPWATYGAQLDPHLRAWADRLKRGA
jgi:hypothetical protein